MTSAKKLERQCRSFRISLNHVVGGETGAYDSWFGRSFKQFFRPGMPFSLEDFIRDVLSRVRRSDCANEILVVVLPPRVGELADRAYRPFHAGVSLLCLFQGVPIFEDGYLCLKSLSEIAGGDLEQRPNSECDRSLGFPFGNDQYLPSRKVLK